MSLTRSVISRLIKIVGIILIAGLIISYAAWRSLNYARGPSIVILDPPQGSTIIETRAIIRGKALRVNNLSLNGQPISIDEQGNFADIISIFPGVNVITLRGQDQFGRSTDAQLQLVGSKWPDAWYDMIGSRLPITSK